MKKIFIFIIFIFLFCLHSLMYSGITTQIDPAQPSAGRPFKLILTLDGTTTNDLPDLTPLQQDFAIVGTEQNMHYTFINGHANSSSQWVITLMPKKIGNLIIPALQVGKETTQASKIQVMSKSNNVNAHQVKNLLQQDVQLEITSNEKEPYINQQIILTVKLYNSRRLIDANYQPPQAADSLLFPMGKANRYQTTVNNRLYIVEEQKYILFPQKSGKLQIESPEFQALLYDEGLQQRINVKAKPLTLDIKSIPASIQTKHWLPAKQVTINESYADHNIEFKQGDTLERTITLQAIGSAAQLLPVSDFAGNNFNVYLDKPKEKNVISNNNLIGTVTIKATYLLNKSGIVKIPQLQFNWYNTTLARQEISTLPERILTVKPLANKTTTKTPTNNSSISSSKIDTTSLNAALITNHGDMAQSSPSLFNFTPNAALWLAGCFAGAWLLTITLWYLQQRRYKFLNLNVAKPQTEKSIQKALYKACKENDTHAAKHALILWAKMRWPKENILNLEQLENLVKDQTMQKELNKLSQVLYYKANAIWKGSSLWEAMTAFKHKKPKKITEELLPPIHKL